MNTTLTLSKDQVLAEVDSALAADAAAAATAAAPAAESAPEPAQQGLSRLARLLRGGGALVLIAAALTFLLQSWQGFSHIERYLSFLGFSTIIAATALFTWLRLRDDKGARTLLAVAAAIVPVHFSQLGAMLYSRFGRELVFYPDLLKWEVPSAGAAVAITLVGVAVLTPITLFAFKALARPAAGLLCLTYLGANALLLLPFRAEGFVAAALLLALPALGYLDFNYLRGEAALRTPEGRLIRLLPLLPLVLLLGRTIALYSVTAVLISVLWAVAALLLYFVPASYFSRSHFAVTSQRLATIPAALSWLTILPDLIAATGLEAYGMLLLGLPPALLLVLMGIFALKASANWNRSAALLATGAVTLQLLTIPVEGTLSGYLLGSSPHLLTGLLSALICISVTLVVSAYGAFNRDGALLLVGGSGFLFGLIYNLRLAAFQLFDSRPWLCLGLLGLSAVLAAALIERRPQWLINGKSLISGS